MIKKSTYIRKFSEKQIKQMLIIQEQQKNLKTVPDILFFALEKYHELVADNNRLNRLIDYKQIKIDNLNLQLCQFGTHKTAE